MVATSLMIDIDVREDVLGASESILRPTSIQDRQQTYCNFVEIIEYFMINNLGHPDFD